MVTVAQSVQWRQTFGWNRRNVRTAIVVHPPGLFGLCRCCRKRTHTHTPKIPSFDLGGYVLEKVEFHSDYSTFVHPDNLSNEHSLDRVECALGDGIASLVCILVLCQ